MGNLYMIRHGQASFGSENYDRLSETGQLQARILAEHLLAIGLAPDAIYAGDMERQKDTAGALVQLGRERGAPLPGLRIEKAFNEYSSRQIILSYAEELAGEEPAVEQDRNGDYVNIPALERLLEKVLLRWVNGGNGKPGRLTWEQFRERVVSGLKRVIAENGRGRTILLFTSGGPISAVIQTALGLSNEETLRAAWRIANGSVTKFLYNGERISLASFNETAHLALRRDPALITYR
jgi:broad specificity phosphatase PhoE